MSSKRKLGDRVYRGMVEGVKLIWYSDSECCVCCAMAVMASMLMYAKSKEAKGATLPQKNLTAIVQKEVNQNKQGRQSSQDNFLLREIERYQKEISPALKAQLGVKKICRYTPSCSEYAKQAITKYGNARGTAKAVARLARCNPLSKGGYNPVK